MAEEGGATRIRALQIRDNSIGADDLNGAEAPQIREKIGISWTSGSQVPVLISASQLEMRSIGTSPNNLLQLDSLGRLPSVDGSQLTNLPSMGAQGAPGPQGAQGSIGSTGAQGTSGDSGVQGSTGSQGAAGAQGSAGAQGASGGNGAQGSQGTAGAQGSTGSSGAQGATGSQGATGTGLQGSQGAAGAQGLAGGTGAQGAQGPQGPAGSGSSTTGAQGAQGPQGYQGVAGALGTTGAQGATGFPATGTWSVEWVAASGGALISASGFTLQNLSSGGLKQDSAGNWYEELTSTAAVGRIIHGSLTPSTTTPWEMEWDVACSAWDGATGLEADEGTGGKRSRFLYNHASGEWQQASSAQVTGLFDIDTDDRVIMTMRSRPGGMRTYFVDGAAVGGTRYSADATTQGTARYCWANGGATAVTRTYRVYSLRLLHNAVSSAPAYTRIVSTPVQP